jgi:hypothetical protein
VPKQETEFWDPFAVDRGSWTPIEGVAGLSELVLTRDEDTGSYTRLLKFEPGADTRLQGVQKHDFYEEVLIYKGAIHDVTLGQTFSAGQYAYRLPGMVHGPWVAPEGCITFEIRTFER